MLSNCVSYFLMSLPQFTDSGISVEAALPPKPELEEEELESSGDELEL